jgi:hypothetical protein
MLKRGSEQKASFQERLDEQQDWVEKRLAREIELADLAQSEATTMKVKFASHLKRLQGSVLDAENAHASDVDAMKKKISVLSLQWRCECASSSVCLLVPVVAMET